MDQRGMGRLGEQPAGSLLSPDGERAKAACGRREELEPFDAGRRQRAAGGLIRAYGKAKDRALSG